MPTRTIKIGTRGSKLALAQASFIIDQLKHAVPDLKAEINIIKTSGDRDRATALKQMGGVGVFTKAIEQALLDGQVDIAVHSAKDLPSEMTDGLTLGAVPLREACHDILISGDASALDQLAAGAIVGTGSPRRRALLLDRRSDLDVREIRGNVATRLGKLDEGQYDALVMAQAGLNRLGLERSVVILPPEQFIPAAGQGFLAVQVRADDRETRDIAARIDNRPAHRCLKIERLLLAGLGAGCSAAVGAWAREENHGLRLTAVVLDADGHRRLDADARIKPDDADENLVEAVTKQLLSQGAGDLIED